MRILKELKSNVEKPKNTEPKFSNDIVSIFREENSKSDLEGNLNPEKKLQIAENAITNDIVNKFRGHGNSKPTMK